MAKDFKKKLQDLLFPKRPDNILHELVISPDDVVIGTETVKELNSDNPLQFRLNKLKEITVAVARQRLEEHAVEAIWVAIQDLVQPTNPLEVREIVLTFLKSLILGQYDHLQLLRDHFFRVVATHNIEEDFTYRLDILIELTCKGRNVTCFEEEIGSLLLNWMPVMATHDRLSDFLNLLVNIIHYNSTYLDDHIISGLVLYTCAICDRLEQVSLVMEACLSVFDSVLRYSCLTASCLRGLIFTLCHTVNREAVCHTSWQLVSNLLGTHLGDRGIYILCCILEEEDSAKDALLLQGAVYFLGMSLWGARKVPSLRHSYASVLPSVVKALKCGHSSVAFEVVCSVDRLVRKYGQGLRLVTWDLITNVLETVGTHVENELSLEDGSPVAQRLHCVCCCIEDLCGRNSFSGSWERFFNLVEKFTLQRPESCTLALVSFRAESIMIMCPDWMVKLCSLMEKYYRHDTRTNVRLKALTILSSVLSSCRYTFEEELIEVVVLPYLLSVHEDSDMTVRTAVTQLLVDLAYGCDTPHFFDIINAINKVTNRETKPQRDQGASPSSMTGRNSETDDIETAVVGLIGLFKWKLFRLPSTHCFYLYESLITHVRLHYERQSFNQDTAGILQKVFECLLQLRSDSYHHLGVVNDDGSRVFSCFVMCNGSSANSTEERRSKKTKMSSSASSTSITHAHNPLSFVTAFDLTLMCLQQELDKSVVTNVLRLLSDTLSNHTLILACNADLNTLCQILCRMVRSSHGVADLSVIGKQHRPELAEFVYPVLTVLATYPRQLEKKHQLDLIRCIESGIRSRSSHACIESLSLCCMEMQIVMARLIPSVLITLSQLSATVALSLPVLEFLSTLSCLDELYKGFHESQYRAIFATALPYTDPTKFSVQVVSLAYHTIFTWFVKTSLCHRKVLVKFISKGLHRVTGALPDTHHNFNDVCSSQTALKMDSLSNNGSLVEETTERASLHRSKNVPSEFLFHEEMREVCIDLMLRYTYSTCYTQPTRSVLASSLISGGQMKHWLVGNSIVTITTAASNKLNTSVGSSRALTPGVSHENSATSSAQLSPVRSTPLASAYDTWKSPCLDASYCQGWAEVWVRRPTGNMAWMMKMENKPEHCRKSVPIGVFASSTPGLQPDDLTAISGHSAFCGVTPQSPLSTGLCPHSVRQKTPFAMFSPVPQTQPVFDVLTDDIAKTDRKIFQLDSPLANRKQFQFQQKETAPTPVPGQRARKQLEFPKPCLGMSPLDHDQVIPRPGMAVAHVDQILCPSAVGTQAFESIEDLSVRSPVSDSAIQAPTKKLHRHDSCPQLQSKDDTISLKHQVLVRQQSKEAEDMLCSPTSPEVDKTLLAPSNTAIIPPTFPAVQRRQSSATTTDDVLDPSFLFLQLYGHVLVRADDETQPVLLPKSDCVDRSLKVMDHLQPYNTHKIGVVYIGKGQHTETAILWNEFGSSQYFQFLSGLGELISLSDCRSNDVYLGGLSQTGEDGQYTYVWTNEISQVVFHVATLMTNRASDPQCHAKKRHIGNDFVKIVFNESGEEYQPDAKAQFNLVDIVISTVSEESYQVTVHTKTGITPPIYDASPRIVSDECLPLLVRQMAFHADLSCMAHYSEQSPGDQTLNWIERLRKIKHLHSKISSDKGSDAVFTDYT